MHQLRPDPQRVIPPFTAPSSTVSVSHIRRERQRVIGVEHDHVTTVSDLRRARNVRRVSAEDELRRHVDVSYGCESG